MTQRPRVDAGVVTWNTRDLTVQALRTLMENDQGVDLRVLVRTWLELDGDHEVVAEAVDGPEALAAYDALGAPPTPDVVILDNRMPGLSGLDVAALMLARVPSQRIVLFTAFADDVIATEAAEIGVARVVSKSDYAKLPEIIRSLG